MNLKVALPLGLVLGSGILLAAAAIRDAQDPPRLPPAPPDVATSTSTFFRGWMNLIRGPLGALDPRLQARADEIIDYVARRRAAKIDPAVTKAELDTLYLIARSA